MSTRKRTSIIDNKLHTRLLVLGFFIFSMSAWHFLVQWLEVSPMILPGPLPVFEAFYTGMVSGEFWPHIQVTLYEILAGFAIGSIAGFLLGLVIGQSRLMEAVLYPYVVAFQTMPKVAIAPLFVVWFGFGEMSKIIITAAIVFFPLLANTIVGLRSAPKDQIDLFRSATATEWQILYRLRLPHALPYVFAGLDIGIVLAVIGAIVGEFVGAQAGLGYLILQRNFSMDTAGVFAILIVLCIIGLVLHAVMKHIARKTLFWSESNNPLSDS